MADIYGSYFEYATKSSEDYGLILATVESSRMDKCSGEIKGNTIFNKSANKKYLINDDRSDSPLLFEVEIVTDNQRVIDYQERRIIEKWLFNRHDYRKLYIDMADDPYSETYEIIDGVRKRNYLNCRFINPEKLIYNGGVVGYKATLEADSDMFWQDEIRIGYKLSSSANLSSLGLDKIVDVSSGYSASRGVDISIVLDTDYNDYTYPTISFRSGINGGDITITNKSDDVNRVTEFVNISHDVVIDMHGDINYIHGNTQEDYYSRFRNRNFVRLVQDTNIIHISGDVAYITFVYQNRRIL